MSLTKAQEEKVTLENQLRDSQRDSESRRLDCEAYQVNKGRVQSFMVAITRS